MRLFHSNFGGRERDVSLGLVDKCRGAPVGRHSFVKLDVLVGVQLTVQQIKNMLNESPYTRLPRFLVFAGGRVLASRPNEEVGWQAL